MTEREGYCVRCKKKRLIAEAEEVTMKNGRPVIKGKCPKCGSGMYRILPVKITEGGRTRVDGKDLKDWAKPKPNA